MPVYKGTTEITSGKLYKATTNIENGYKGTNSFYVNETTVSLTAPSGWTLSASSFTGVPGTQSSNFTLTRAGQGALVLQHGTPTLTASPSLTLTLVSSNYGSGLNNSATHTYKLTFPTVSQSSTLSITQPIHTYAGIVNITPNLSPSVDIAGCYAWNSNQIYTSTQSFTWTNVNGSLSSSNAIGSCSGMGSPTAQNTSYGFVSGGGSVSFACQTQTTTWDTGPVSRGLIYASFSNTANFYMTGTTSGTVHSIQGVTPTYNSQCSGSYSN